MIIKSFPEPLGTKFEQALISVAPQGQTLDVWEKDWQNWRGVIISVDDHRGTGICGGSSVYEANVELVMVLLMLDILSGFGLIATGFFFYRRAFW